MCPFGTASTSQQAPFPQTGTFDFGHPPEQQCGGRCRGVCGPPKAQAVLAILFDLPAAPATTQVVSHDVAIPEACRVPPFAIEPPRPGRRPTAPATPCRFVSTTLSARPAQVRPSRAAPSERSRAGHMVLPGRGSTTLRVLCAIPYAIARGRPPRFPEVGIPPRDRQGPHRPREAPRSPLLSVRHAVLCPMRRVAERAWPRMVLSTHDMLMRASLAARRRHGCRNWPQ